MTAAPPRPANPPMIDQESRIRPTMIAIGVVFLLGLIAIAVTTIVAVASQDGMGPADVDTIAFPAGVEVIAEHSLCSAEACEGEGAVLLATRRDVDQLQAAVADRMVLSGWSTYSCGPESTCLRSLDLRAALLPWSAVEEDAATSALRTRLAGMEYDQGRMVYLRVWRCGILTPCA